MITLAESRKRPVIVLEVSVGEGGEPVLEVCDKARLTAFAPPTLPHELADARIPATPDGSLPSSGVYCESLKSLGSDNANRLRFYFQWAALIIVGGHVLATVLAVCALKLEGGFVLWLLGFELVLLAGGLFVHHRLHKAHSIGHWATFRLIAEIARSVRAIGAFHVYFEHFFTLPFPDNFRPLLRTISVLHLKDTAATPPGNWDRLRRTYLIDRLVGPEGQARSNAQIPYNTRTHAHATSRLGLARDVFYLCSYLALGAAFLKLLSVGGWLPWPHEAGKSAAAVFGAMAVIFPVLAVAALSLAAAFDLEARVHTSAEGKAAALCVISLITEGMAAMRGRCNGSNASENAGAANAGEYS